MSSSNPPPVSLGKPSLRHRLESYYSLVAPEAIADAEDWKRKFEIIYNKYGGTNVEDGVRDAKQSTKRGANEKNAKLDRWDGGRGNWSV
jgi:hypothetical protein